MKLLGLVTFVVGSVVFASHAGTTQNKPDIRPETELKQVSTTALSIVRREYSN